MDVAAKPRAEPNRGRSQTAGWQSRGHIELRTEFDSD
jgi:hypothetical protein